MSYFNESIRLAEEIEALPEKIMNYEQMAIVSFYSGNSNQTYYYYNNYKTLYDSLRKMDTTFVLPNKTAVPAKNTKINSQKNNLFSLIYIPLLLGLIFILIKSYRKKH